MPFLITDQNKDLLSGLIESEIVTCEEFLNWRTSHLARIKRNNDVSGVSLAKDKVYVRFRKQQILDLISLNMDHHLGILFSCNWVDPNYKYLSVFICSAQRDGHKFHVLSETVQNSKGIKKNYAHYLDHYANRIRTLRKESKTNDFGIEEMSGIYHLSSDISLFLDKIKTKYVRFCFLHDLKKTTVIIADDKFDLIKYVCTNLAEPALYDHGTGCCTITDN